MASNKKAQILAAVMCASSILGSYTMVSAETTTVTLDDNVFTIAGATSTGTTATIGAGATIGANVNITYDENNKRTIIGGSRIFDNGQFWTGNGKFKVGTDGTLSIKNSENANSFSVRADNGQVRSGNIISSGSIKADSLISSKQDIALLDADGSVRYKMSTIGDNTAGIVRDGEKTIIEKNTAVTSTGIVVSKIEDPSVVVNPPTTTTTVKAGYIGIKNQSNDTTFAVDYNGAMKAANGNFEVDKNGTLKVDESADIKIVNKANNTYTTVYSLKDIGANTAGITKVGAITRIEGVDFAKGAVDANSAVIDSAKIGGVNIANGYVDGVDVSELRKDTAGNVSNIAELQQKTTAMSYDEKSGVTNFKGDISATGDVTSGNGYSLDTIGANTANISKIGDTTVVDKNLQVQGSLVAGGGNLRVDADGKLNTKGDVVTLESDGITTKYSLNTIGDTTAGISRDEETTTIEGVASFNKDGMTVNTGNSFVNVGTDNIVLNNSGNGIVIDKDGTSIIGAQGKHSINITRTGTEFLNGQDGTSTVISGGDITTDTITTDTIKIGDKTIDDDFFGTTGDTNTNTKGIKRNEETTTIEGVASFNKDGMTVNTGNSFVNVGTDNIVLNNSGNGIVIDKDGTSIIGAQGKHSINITRTGTEFLNGQDGTSTVISGGDITTDTITTDTIKIGDKTIDDDFFGTTGDTNTNTAGIHRDPSINNEFTTSIETTFRVHSSEGYNAGTIDVYGSMIQSKGANGQITAINGGSIITNELTVGGVSFGELVNRVEDLEDKTQNITPSNPGTGEGGSVVPPTTDGQTGINGDVTVGGDLSVGGNLTADSATIGGVTMKDNTVTATTGNFDNIAVGGENGTNINKDGITVGKAEEGQSYTSITKDDVKVTDSQGNTTSLTDVGNRVTGLESSMNNMNNRLNDVEDRIDKVGAMAAAIANLRTMGFDPEAPTEIAIGVGQYKSETGLALGVFHYPNQDFMLSASISTSGDEVMGGIGATWKLGRKSAGEKALDAKDEEAKHLEKAEEMKKLAQDAKVKAQAERHAKLLAEREAQKTA